MCRAIWVLIASAADDTFKALRRACGLEAQVVGRIGSTDDVSPQSATPADIVIVDARMGPAIVAAITEAMPAAAILWFGDGEPPGAHHAIAALEDVESAITRALINRRS